MPGDTFSKKVSALKAFASLSGLPIAQLLGGGATPTPQAPVVNTVGEMYSSNPMYQQAFAALDSGNDPDTVLQHLIDTKAVDGTDQNKLGHVFNVLSDYAKANVDNAQTLAAQDQGSSYTLANGKKFKGDPGIMGFTSEYDLLGQPQVADLMKQYAASRPVTQAQTVPQFAGGGLFSQGQSVPNHAGGVDVAPGREFANGKLYGGGQTLAQPDQAAAYDAAQSGTHYGLNPLFAQQIEGRLKGRLNSAKTNMVRSDANTAAMQNLLSIRALLGV
jgi:hypothetical protein